jgi:hypothetical protein
MAKPMKEKGRREKAKAGWRRFYGAALLLALWVAPSLPQGETNLKKEYPNPATRPRQVDLSHNTKPPDPIGNAIGQVCRERAFDPLGSTPIDILQARPSLSLKNPDVQAALKRAEQLLPLARELTIEALRDLAAEHKLEELRVRTAETRIRAVTRIEPDVDLRDNASVSVNRPTLISFGTLFLVGLPSNEAMISVLAHELTHLGDGKEDSLQPLFVKVGRRVSSLVTGVRLQVSGRRAEELTCDLIGTLTVRKLIARTPNARETLVRRLTRALAHNCVERDETDEAHLSPRNTMRALLALDEALANGLLGRADNSLLQPFELFPARPAPSDAEALLFASERCRAGL